MEGHLFDNKEPRMDEKETIRETHEFIFILPE